MGLVLAAPAEVLVPLMETSVGAPSQATAPADGVFASLLASLSAAVEAETTDPLTDSPGLSMAEPSIDREEEKSDSDRFSVLMSMAVSLPVIPLPVATSAPERAFDHAAGSKSPAGILASTGTSQSVEVTQAMVPTDSPAPVAAPTEAIPAAKEEAERAPVKGPPVESMTVERTPVETTPAVSTPKDPREIAAASPVPEEAPATGPASESVRPSGAVTVAAAGTQSVATVASTPPTEAHPDGGPKLSKAADGAQPPGTHAASNSPSVVRSVGNAESGDKPPHDNNGNGSKNDVERPLPRASAQGIAHAADGSAVAQLRTPVEAGAVEGPSPLPTEAASVAETPPQVRQVAQTVIESIEKGGGEARIHLDPAGLGEVTIHVRTEGEHVRVEVRAERQEAMQLLRDHTRDLSNLLGERGLNLSDVNVGLGGGNSDQAWGRDEGRQNQPWGNEFASILGIGEPAALETHNRLRAAYNPDGALVYRV